LAKYLKKLCQEKYSLFSKKLCNATVISPRLDAQRPIVVNGYNLFIIIKFFNYRQKVHK